MNVFKNNDKKIVWTLSSLVPKYLKNKFKDSSAQILHIPLIKLSLNDNYNKIDSIIKNYNKFIVTSPYAAKVLSNHLNSDHEIYTVGEKVCSILYKFNLRIIKSFFNSDQLSSWLRENLDSSIIHLCSEKSDKSIFPNNVDSYAFYRPFKNDNINKEAIQNLDNSTIIFGSPSGVEAWFEFENKNNFNSYACMGNTTAKTLSKFTENSIIFPQDSRTKTLVSLISKHHGI